MGVLEIFERVEATGRGKERKTLKSNDVASTLFETYLQRTITCTNLSHKFSSRVFTIPPPPYREQKDPNSTDDYRKLEPGEEAEGSATYSGEFGGGGGRWNERKNAG